MILFNVFRYKEKGIYLAGWCGDIHADVAWAIEHRCDYAALIAPTRLRQIRLMSYMGQKMTENTVTHNPMSLEEARKVLWLKNSVKHYRPMGALFDEGYLTQDRIEWAIQKAYKTEQKQAAQILLQ